ncbi:MAG TPA: selenium-dependent xanthine dehydrogenase [Ornithinibacter sp.]|nr:selenium-dependent xanthine dehydrogenase [Ornithinibacter sp.]
MTTTVNGLVREVPSGMTLMTYLREVLGLTSVKDGCADGSCGTCLVVVDGKTVKACTRDATTVEGRHVTTTEGLTAREKEAVVSAYEQEGAVQCGFCMPGFVMTTKALLDANPDPSREQVVRAVRANVCRCTGYRMVEDAVLRTGRILRGEEEVPPPPEHVRMSDRVPRPDAAEKVLGTGLYTDDIRLEGMVHAKALRTAHPRAVVDAIDVTAARAHPDCLAVLTARDVPENTIGHLVHDWDVLIAEGDTTRYVGDAVALVVCEHEEALDEVLALVDVRYTELEPVTSPEQALAPGAPQLHPGGNVLAHERVTRGDADAALARSAFVVSNTFHTPWQEHAFLEPECAVARPWRDGGVEVFTAGQSVYDEQREIARMLRLPAERVHAHSMLVGGGFGGKEDMSVQHHAALAAWHTGRPVKVKFSRAESVAYHVKRHPMDLELTLGCDASGRLTGLKARIVADTGAYASLGGPVLQRAVTHAGGPYDYQDFDCEGLAVYTNNPVSGAFRGFGVAQSAFALESSITLLAAKAGIDPWEFRHRNAIRPGQVLPNGQVADEATGLVECLEALKPDYDADPGAGLAVAFKNSGLGMGVPDTGRCLISVEQGVVHVRTSAAGMGQGVSQMALHMLCQTVDIPPDLVVVEAPDTERTPDAGTSTASRQTVLTGEAVRLAALRLREALGDAGASGLAAVEGRVFEGEFSPVTDPIGSDKPNPVSHVTYGYGAQLVHLAEDGRVRKVVAAYDAGTVVNQQALQGQIEGGIVMGLGYALTEEFVVEGGVPRTTFAKLGLIRSTQAPEMEVRTVRGPGVLPYAYGAKGVGEICLIPTAPAVAHAYLRRDGKERLRLPLEDTYYRR